MDVTVLLLIVAGTIGAVDILYYHLYKFRLSRRPGSRAETATHILRAFTFAFGVWILLGNTPMGGWYWALAAVFILDFIDGVVDVAIEPRSRKSLGGLPPLEYTVHMLSATLTGGAWVTFLVAGWAGRLAPTALVDRTSALPAWLILDGRAIAVSSVLLGTAEAALLVHGMLTAPRQPSSAVAPGEGR